MLGLAASDLRLDPAAAQLAPVLVVVVAAVGRHTARPAFAADQPCRARAGSARRAGVAKGKKAPARFWLEPFTWTGCGRCAQLGCGSGRKLPITRLCERQRGDYLRRGDVREAGTVLTARTLLPPTRLRAGQAFKSSPAPARLKALSPEQLLARLTAIEAVAYFKNRSRREPRAEYNSAMKEPTGERRNVAILIADVADSTAIGERLGPERSKFLRAVRGRRRPPRALLWLDTENLPHRCAGALVRDVEGAVCQRSSSTGPPCS